MTAAFTLVAAAASDTGLVRKNNEDAAYSGRWLFAVADGLGGHAAGEVASAAAIKSFSNGSKSVKARSVHRWAAFSTKRTIRTMPPFKPLRPGRIEPCC